MTAPTAADPAGPSEGSPFPPRERSLAWRLLIVVGVAYVVAQVALLSLARPPGWDEAVYLSQVTPGTDALEFLAWRARGITLLVAPVTWLGGSVRDVRIFLMVASALTMTATFRLWIPLIGLAAPAAAVAFSFSWLGLLSGTEVMPNLWAALPGLATAGLIARRLGGGKTWHAVLASGTLAATALVRPTEATVVAGAIALYIVVCRRTEWRLLFAIGLGLVLGWLPWFVEMSARFGGPVDALREAATGHFATAPVAQNVVNHLAFTDGRPPDSPVPLGGVLWWVLLAILTIVAIAGAMRPTERAAAILAGFGASALATEYLVFAPGMAPRFLLPAYAFASVPAAIGILTLLRGGAIVPRVAGAAILILVLPWAIWQGTVARRFQEGRTVSTVAFRDIGLTLRELAGGRPCSFVSPNGYPSIALASGCDGSALIRPGGPTASELEELRSAEEELFVILKREARLSSPLGSLTPVPVAGPGKTWFVYHVSGST